VGPQPAGTPRDGSSDKNRANRHGEAFHPGVHQPVWNGRHKAYGNQEADGKRRVCEPVRSQCRHGTDGTVQLFSFLHHHPFSIAPLSSLGTDAVPVERLLDSIHDSTTPAEKCREFLDECPIRWVVAHNLTVGEDQWIPIDWFYLINEYNGAAAGNTLEEAILQSLCEVVERHVGTVVSYGKIPTPRIDVRSLEDPVAIELVEKFHRLGIRLFLRDFSLDTGIPTVGALAYDPSTFPERSEIVFTAGTTTNPEKSLCRALTEIAQLAGDFANRTSYRPTLPKYESLDEAAYLMDTGDLVSVRSLP